MSVNPQAERKSFRGAIERFGRKIGKVARRPFKQSKKIDTSTSSDEEDVPPYRVIQIEVDRQCSTQRTACIPKQLKSRRATPVLTTPELIVEEGNETQEQENDQIQGNELVLWQQNSLNVVKQVACDFLENAQPAPATFLFATSDKGESIIISRDVTALPWSDKQAIAGIQALFVSSAGDNTAKAHIIDDAPDTSTPTTTMIAARLHSWEQLVQMAVAHFQDILSTLLQTANAHIQGFMWLHVRSVLMAQSSTDVFGGEFKIPYVAMKPAGGATRAILSRIAAFNVARAGLRHGSEQGSSTSSTRKVERQAHDLLLPAPAESSISSPYESGNSSDEDARPETPHTEQSSSDSTPIQRLFTPEEALKVLSFASIFKHCEGDLDAIAKCYPPNGFYVRPEQFDAVQEDLRKKSFYIANNYHDEVPKFLPGLIGEDVDGVLEKDPNICPLGECMHLENPCWPARHFINLGKLMQEMGIVKDDGDQLHIAINVTGPCAMMAYPPYGEVEIHAKSIMDVKIFEKNMMPTGVIGDHCEYTYGLESRFVDFPIFIHCNEHIPEMVLDFRIGDVIAPLLESAAPPVLLAYLDDKNGAEYHRAPFAKYYRQKDLLGEVIRIKAVPQVWSDDDFEKEQVSVVEDTSHLQSDYSWASTIQFSDDGDDEEPPVDDDEELEVEDVEEPVADDEADSVVQDDEEPVAKDEEQDKPLAKEAESKDDVKPVKASKNKRVASMWAAPGNNMGEFETYNAPNTTFADLQPWLFEPSTFKFLTNGNALHEWPTQQSPTNPHFVFQTAKAGDWERCKEMARECAVSNVEAMRQQMAATPLKENCVDTQSLVPLEDVVLFNCWSKGIMTSEWLNPQDDPYDREAARLELRANLGPASEITSGYFGYDCDQCECVQGKRGKCHCCAVKGRTEINPPFIVDWIEAVEENRVDGEWQGENGSIEHGEDLPGSVLTPAQQEAMAKKIIWHHWQLRETMDRQLTRGQGGLVRWARNWLSITPEPHVAWKEIKLSDSDELTHVIAHAVSSVQNLELRYSTTKNTLTLLADNIATFEAVHGNTSDEMRAQISKVHKEGWWQPALIAAGVPCQLLCNLPVMRVTMDRSPKWSMGAPHGSMVSYHRVDPGFPQYWR